MPSPFPGMNPYLEQSYDWEEFHNNFIGKMQEFLFRRVGPKYLVKGEVRLILHERSAAERRFIGRSDVGVTGSGDRSSAVGTAVLAAPVRLQLPAVDVEKQRYLEIRDMRSRRLVTIIELLSPSNKKVGEDRDSYQAKRKEVLGGDAHLVEIDLRRIGTRPSPPQLPVCDYCVVVSQREDRPNIGVWPFGIRDPLPIVPVPLDSPDPPVSLDLKKILDDTYDTYGYSGHIYLEIPEPPLRTEDEAWARGIAGLPV